MGNSSSRQYSYQQYYTAIQQTGNMHNIDFSKIDIDGLDAYEVLNVRKDFTWEQLKESYRKLALNTHPDKQGGNEQLFNIITACFKKLAKEYQARKSDKQHGDLKKESMQYFERMHREEMPHPSEVINPSKDISNAMFNQTFEKCKVIDEDADFGYGAMMAESSKKREDINIERLIKKNKIDSDDFNQIFNKNVPVSKEIVKYKEPEPLLLAKSIQFTELGGKKPDDYTSSMEQSNKLAYTDYMRAHDGTRLVDPDSVKRKDFKSVAEFEKYRDNRIKRDLTSKEKKMIEEKKLKEEKEEFERLQRLQKYDRNIEKSFQKANTLFLK